MTTLPGDPSSDMGPKLQLSNLSVRVITSIILLPIVGAVTYIGGLPLTILIAVITGIGVLEFYVFAAGRQMQGSAIIGVPMAVVVVAAFHFQENALWIAALVIGGAATFILETVRHPHDARRSLWQMLATLAGVLYVALPASFLIAIRGLPDGLVWLLVIFASTWGTDSFAYLGGRFFGKTKLAPLLSPKKTVEGAIIGIVGGLIPPGIILLISGKFSLTTLILIGLAPFAAILGDLFESAIKRKFEVKDSHITGLNIFPGHGGVLDRVDSLIWVATLFYLFLIILGVGR
jgi:phosphatidate cytidylyltransferase